MSFIGHSTMRRAAEDPPEGQEKKTATVKVWGEAKDAVQVDGPLEGCKAYPATDLELTLEGEHAGVRLRVFYEDPKWRITVGHADRKDVLSVWVTGGQGDSAVMATVESVQSIQEVHREDGKKK